VAKQAEFLAKIKLPPPSGRARFSGSTAFLEGAPSRASPVNEREKRRLYQLREAGYTQSEVAGILGVAQSTVSKAETLNKYGTGGKAGRPSLLSQEEHDLLRQRCEVDPFGGTQALVDFLWEKGIECSKQTVRRELLRCTRPDELPATKRAVSRYAHFTRDLLDIHMMWHAGLTAAVESGDLDWRNLHYADETELIWGLARHSGTSCSPLYASEAHKTRGGGKIWLYGIIGTRGWEARFASPFHSPVGLTRACRSCTLKTARRWATTSRLTASCSRRTL
jgi:hypothetical protein